MKEKNDEILLAVLRVIQYMSVCMYVRIRTVSVLLSMGTEGGTSSSRIDCGR